MKNLIFIALTSLILAGCTSHLGRTFPDYTQDPRQVKNREKLMDVFDDWEGTPYRIGGTSQSGIDCSGFAQMAYKKALRKTLKRMTSLQKSQGRQINVDNIKVGDLVFFRANRHVGIYVGNGEFIHASTSSGVIKSSMNEDYYHNSYTQTRRLGF